MSLTEVLPTEPVAPGARQTLQRGERVGDGEDPGALESSRALRAHDHAPGAGRDRCRRELAAIDPLAAQAEEEVALRCLAGIDDAAPRIARPAPRDDLRAHRRPDLLRGQVHNRRNSSRATSRSSKGSLRPFSNSCPCS